MISEAPVLNTRRLFGTLLSRTGIDLVFDIGSMDGRDSLYFRRRAPASRVIAFEPNPVNLERMRANPALAALAVTIEPLALCEQDGDADFFVVRSDHPEWHARNGMSSLYRRADPALLQRVVRVPVARLDGYVQRNVPEAQRLALWIDAEGKGWEVIEGARAILQRVHLIHVEVETQALIGAGQKTFTDIDALLSMHGFTRFASDYPLSGRQFNVLYARLPTAPAARAALKLLRGLAIWRRRASNVVYRLLPGRVRGLLAGRFRIRGSIG